MQIASSAVIDDLSREPPISSVGTEWQLFTDRVMGGVSQGTMVREVVAARPAIRMRGEVSLENNGGFIQIGLDLAPGGATVDATTWRGIEIDAYGNDEQYGIHLRTAHLTKPWQSYRQTFKAEPRWRIFQFPFEGFVPHRTDVPLDTRFLRRIGLVAIGRVYSADLALGGLRFFV